jgi:hypothetical protein
VKCTGRIEVEFDSPQEAQVAAHALGPDGGTGRVDGTRLVVEAEASSPMGLLRSLDDVLVCLRAVQ